MATCVRKFLVEYIDNAERIVFYDLAKLHTIGIAVLGSMLVSLFF